MQPHVNVLSMATSAGRASAASSSKLARVDTAAPAKAAAPSGTPCRSSSKRGVPSGTMPKCLFLKCASRFLGSLRFASFLSSQQMRHIHSPSDRCTKPWLYASASSSWPCMARAGATSGCDAARRRVRRRLMVEHLIRSFRMLGRKGALMFRSRRRARFPMHALAEVALPPLGTRTEPKRSRANAPRSLQRAGGRTRMEGRAQSSV